MKPILVIQHHAGDGPAYLGHYLDHAALSWQLLRVDQGEAVPGSITGYAGLALLGGPMSVNDALPWRGPELSLIRQAVSRRVPVIGHCLGGQLLSKALGGTVSAAAHPEIGWSDVVPVDQAGAQRWFGGAELARLFQWHGETFSIPAGATLIATGRYCAHQAYVADGIHLGMQFHCEVDRAKIAAWLTAGGDDIEAGRHSPGVQSADAIRTSLDASLPVSHRLADNLYSAWLANLAR